MGHPSLEFVTVSHGHGTSLSSPSLDGIQVLVSPDSKPQPPGAPLPVHAPQNEAAVNMRELLTGETGKALYARRKATVEPVFGQIKEAWDSQIPVPWSEECSLRMETHLCHAQSAKALPLSGRPRLHLSSFEGRSRLFIVLKARFLRRKRRRNNMLAVIWYFDLRCVFLAVRIAPLPRLLSDRLSGCPLFLLFL